MEARRAALVGLDSDVAEPTIGVASNWIEAEPPCPRVVAGVHTVLTDCRKGLRLRRREKRRMNASTRLGTRRSFLCGLAGSAVAGSALPVYALESPAPAASASASYDVAIVGAGIAGMAAAQILTRAGKRVIVLEAMDRVGGRCVSDNTTFPGVVFDRGAQWFHQVLGGNPLFDVARARGLHPVEDTAPRQVWRGSRYDAAATEKLDALYEKASAALAQSGERVYLGKPDVNGATALRLAGLAGKPWTNLVEALIGPLTAGAEFGKSSAFDLGNFTEALSGDDYLLRGGMGNFIASFANGLNISLDTPVKSIAYGGREGAVLATSKGAITAGLVIVTVSMGVLAAEAIRFEPALPEAYRQAIDDLPMGVFEKVALGFSSDVFGNVAANTNIFQAVDSEQTPAVIAKLWDHNVAVVYFGGDRGIALDGRGIEASKAFALETVAKSFPKAKRFHASSFTPWLKNPWTRGSYTYAKPGGVPARRVPVTPLGGNQLYFAGEALSMHSYGTLSAAYQSGVAAAKAILGIPSIVSLAD